MRLHLSVALLLGGLAIGQGACAQERNAAEEAQRWELVRDPVFHGRTIQDAGDEVKIIVPERAMDAALVPITAQLAAQKRAVAVTLFIDNNPAPVVGTFRFGPAISPSRSSFVCASTTSPPFMPSRKWRTELCWRPRNT